jgi:hypothetical protein
MTEKFQIKTERGLLYQDPNTKICTWSEDYVIPENGKYKFTFVEAMYLVEHEASNCVQLQVTQQPVPVIKTTSFP